MRVSSPGKGRGGEGRGRRSRDGGVKGIPVCGVCVCLSVLTVPGCPDYVHVLLQVLDDLCQDAVLFVDVLQDLCAVVDVAAPGVLELRGRLGGGVGGAQWVGHVKVGVTHRQHTPYKHTHTHTHTRAHTHTHTHLGVETADFPEVLQSGQDPLAASLQLSDAALEPPHLAVVLVLRQAWQEGAWQEGAEQVGGGYNHNSLVAVLLSTRDLPNETLHTPQPDTPSLTPHTHLTPYTAPVHRRSRGSSGVR